MRGFKITSALQLHPVSFCGATYGEKLKLLLQFHQVRSKTDETHEHVKQEADFAL